MPELTAGVGAGGITLIPKILTLFRVCKSRTLQSTTRTRNSPNARLHASEGLGERVVAVLIDARYVGVLGSELQADVKQRSAEAGNRAGGGARWTFYLRCMGLGKGPLKSDRKDMLGWRLVPR